MSCGLAGRVLLRVDVRGAAPDCADALSDVELIERADGRTFRLSPAADPQRILDAARQSGSVTHFAELQPTLAELFRDVVSA